MMVVVPGSLKVVVAASEVSWEAVVLNGPRTGINLLR
jgi:hypothetical protein